MADQSTLFTAAAVDAAKADRRAEGRARAKREAVRQQHPPTMPGFGTVIYETALEYLRAGQEYDEHAFVEAQRSALAQLPAEQRDGYRPVGLTHPDMGPPISRAIDRYQTQHRIREAHRLCTPPCVVFPGRKFSSRPRPAVLPQSREREIELCSCGVHRPSRSSVACWRCGNPWPAYPTDPPERKPP